MGLSLNHYSIRTTEGVSVLPDGLRASAQTSPSNVATAEFVVPRSMPTYRGDSPGMMGENIATRGVHLLGLPVKTRMHIGEATIELTGLRNPCSQLENMMPGLMKACLDHAPDGTLIRKAGVMGIVVTDGVIRPDDDIVIELPNPPYVALMPV